MINLFLRGSDSGKAQDGTCKLKFIKMDIPENYDNIPGNDELPDSIKIKAREIGCILIVRINKRGSKPGAFYLKGNLNSDIDCDIVEKKIIDNYLSHKYKSPLCWISKDRKW